MKQIINLHTIPTIAMTEVSTDAGLVICYLDGEPYKLHNIGHGWTFIGFHNSVNETGGDHTLAIDAMQSILTYTTELFLFSCFEEFVSYHQNR